MPDSVIEEAAHEVAHQLFGEQVNTVHHLNPLNTDRSTNTYFASYRRGKADPSKSISQNIKNIQEDIQN